jgi:Uma2 family endonuclease
VERRPLHSEAYHFVMAARTRQRVTYDDLLKVPEHLVAEIIDGELYASPRPSGPHGRFASALGMDVGSAYDRGRGGPGGWWILDEPELHLEEHVLVPDLAGWCRERMPELPRNHIFAITPDWVCEVLSPSSHRIDRAKKLPIYAEQGVAYAWVVDPEAQTLEVLKLGEGRWIVAATFSGDDVVRAEPFDAIDIELASIWGPPPA